MSAALEDLFWRQPIHRLVKVAALNLPGIERDRLRAPTAFPGPGLLALLREEVLDRGPQENAEAPPRGVVVFEVPLLDELRELGLSEVPCFVGVVALAADIGVERVPVDTAQCLESLAGLRRGRFARGQDLRPTVVVNRDCIGSLPLH